jgi:hypothetical protein
MDDHFLEFHARPTPYVDRFAVTSTRLRSTNPQARALEEQLKQERHLGFSVFWPQIEAMPEPERNFLTAVYIAWAYERDFYEALATGKLPAELLLWQDTGDYEFPDNYYTYEFSPVRVREMVMEEFLDFAQRDARDFTDQLKRIKARKAQAEAAAAIPA